MKSLNQNQRTPLLTPAQMMKEFGLAVKDLVIGPLADKGRQGLHLSALKKEYRLNGILRRPLVQHVESAAGKKNVTWTVLLLILRGAVK